MITVTVCAEMVIQPPLGLEALSANHQGDCKRRCHG
jgi:hypothetical protein